MTRSIAAVVVGLVTLVLAVAAVSWAHRYQVSERRIDLGHQLEAIAGRMQASIAARIHGNDESNVDNTAADDGHPWHHWRIDDTGTLQVSRYNDEALADAIRISRQPPLVGLVTTSDGIDVLVVRTATAAYGLPAGWLVSMESLAEKTGLADLIRQGHRVRLAYQDRPTEALFVSDPVPLVDPVTRSLLLGTDAWQLEAEPRAGWTRSEALFSQSLIGLLLAFAIGAGYLLLARKPKDLEEELLAADRRLERVREELEASVYRQGEVESRLRTATTLDIDSGLPNRQAIIDWTGDHLRLARDNVGAGLSILVLRLENLPKAATILGTQPFYATLNAAIDHEQRELGTASFCGRASDTNFAFCIGAPLDEKDIEAVAHGLLQRFGTGFEVEGGAFDLAPSVGASIACDGYQYAEELLQEASLAALESRSGAQKWTVFDPELRETQTSLLQLESQILRAINEREFRLFCQPIVVTKDASLAGFETLLRWQHPVEGLLTPYRFIEVATASRHMPRLSQWCVEEAIRLADGWMALRDDPFYLSVNLMASDFVRPGFIDQTIGSVNATQLPPERLRIEVTEREIIKDLTTTARATAALEAAGLHVYLDDFGTGFSSLTHLRAFRFHTVKIDQSFVSTMLENPKDHALVQAVIGLVHDLGMQCIAEGVETEAQYQMLRRLGCDYCQGYFFARPIAPEDVPRYLARSDAAVSA